MPVIKEELEKMGGVFNKWHRRTVTFDEEARRISYDAEKPSHQARSKMICCKIVRFAEIVQPRPHSQELYCVHVEGTHDDGTQETWALRMPTAVSFDKWYTAIRNALASQGQMDSLGYGLPVVDPRNGLTFATVPLEHLHKFALLEKAILYYFGHVTMHGYEAGQGLLQEHILAIGDRNLYIFRPNADVLRCVSIDAISGLNSPKDSSDPGAFCVVRVQPTEHDIVFKHTNDGKRICSILNDVHMNSVTNKAHSPIPMDDNCAGPIEAFTFAAGPALALRPLPGYKMKPTSPTPKSKLKIALDVYQQQYGANYNRTAKKKGGKAASSPEAPGGGGGASSPGSGAGGSPGGGGSGSPDGVDDSLARLLKRLHLSNYIPSLRKQHVDVDLLACMDPGDLGTFNITDPAHQSAILKAAQDREANGSPEDEPLPPAPSSPLPGGGGGGGVVIDDDIEVSPASPVGKPMTITLDSDDDDNLMPTVNDSASAASPTAVMRAGVALSDSDDDLVVAASPVKPPAPPIDLDDDI